MRFLFLVAALVAGALVGWLSILAGIWFVMPIFLICAGIVSIALDKAIRWRIVAFSVGLFAMFAVEIGEFVSNVNQQITIQAQQERERKEKEKTLPLPLQR